MPYTDAHDGRHLDALSRQVVALREEVQEFKNIIAGCRYVVPLSEAHRIHAARLPDIARAIATTMERLNARLSAAPKEGCEPPCSCASLRAKGRNAACSRCPPAVSPTRAAAEVHCEVLSRASAESAIYERGGYVSAPTLGPHGHYAGCPGPGGKPCTCAEKDMLPAKPHVLRRCAHIPPEYVGLCALCRPSAPHPPGLMLGEASIDWAAVAQAIVERGPAILLRRGLIPAGSVDEARRALLYAFDAAIGVSGAEARSLVTANIRETEARESRPSCWQCEAPLGTTTGCLTCDAKKREDAQRTPTES